MEVILQKWGNSTGIRIPSNFLKSLNLKANDKLDIYEEDEKIIISKPSKKHLTLKERIDNYNSLPECEKGEVINYDWGEDEGIEKWQ